MLVLPAGADRPRLLYQISGNAEALGVLEHGLRAALELVALWPLPTPSEDDCRTMDPETLEVTDVGPPHPGGWFIETAILYAAFGGDAGAVYTAVRGDQDSAERGWHQRLPWSVLQPIQALKGYDDRQLRGGPSAVCYGPVQERTYRALPRLAKDYAELAGHLRGAHEVIARLGEWATDERRAALEGQAPINEALLDRLPRERLQQIANETRAGEVRRYFRAGDRVFDIPMVQELATALPQWLSIIERVCADVDDLRRGLAKPTLVSERGGKMLPVYRNIAVGLAAAINGALDDERLGSKRGNKHGAYRSEVLDRTAAILRAVYRIEITPEDVRRATSYNRARVHG